MKPGRKFNKKKSTQKLNQFLNFPKALDSLRKLL